MRCLLVLPTYQEAENITAILARIRSAAPEVTVLVVDDSSPDGTAKLAIDEGAGKDGIEVLSRPAKLGLGSAYREGFAWGIDHGFDVMIEMDADFSHDPADIPRLVSGIACGADLVIGSRYVLGGSIPAWGWHRRALSTGGNHYAKWALRLPVADLTSGFRAYRATVLRKIDLTDVRSEGYGFQIEMVRQVALAGGRITEIPIAFADRTRGESKMSARIVLEALVSVTRWALQDRARKLLARLSHRRSDTERSAAGLR